MVLNSIVIGVSVAYSPFFYLLREVCVHMFCSFLKIEVFVFSLLSSRSSLYFVFVKVLCQIDVLSVFSHRLCGLPLIFWKMFLWAEVFNFDAIIMNFFLPSLLFSMYFLRNLGSYPGYKDISVFSWKFYNFSSYDV